MKKRQRAGFGWPFHKHRTERIAMADKLSIEAHDAVSSLSQDACKEDGKSWAAARRAARKLEKAAWLYSQAGLGAARRHALLFSAKCWDLVFETHHAAACREAANEVDVFYTDEDTEL